MIRADVYDCVSSSRSTGSWRFRWQKQISHHIRIQNESFCVCHSCVAACATLSSMVHCCALSMARAGAVVRYSLVERFDSCFIFDWPNFELDCNAAVCVSTCAACRRDCALRTRAAWTAVAIWLLARRSDVDTGTILSSIWRRGATRTLQREINRWKLNYFVIFLYIYV